MTEVSPTFTAPEEEDGDITMLKRIAHEIARARRIQMLMDDIHSALEIEDPSSATIGDIEAWLTGEHQRLAVAAFQLAEHVTGCNDHALRDRVLPEIDSE